MQGGRVAMERREDVDSYHNPVGFPLVRKIDRIIMRNMLFPIDKRAEFNAIQAPEVKSFDVPQLRSTHSVELDAISCYKAIVAMEKEERLTLTEGFRFDPEGEQSWIHQYRCTIEMGGTKVDVASFFRGVSKEFASYLFIQKIRFRYPKLRVPSHKIFKEILYEDAILGVINKATCGLGVDFGIKIAKIQSGKNEFLWKVGLRLREKVFIAEHPVKLYAIYKALKELVPLITGYGMRKIQIFQDKSIPKEAQYVHLNRWSMGPQDIRQGLQYAQGCSYDADSFFHQPIDDASDEEE